MEWTTLCGARPGPMLAAWLAVLIGLVGLSSCGRDQGGGDEIAAGSGPAVVAEGSTGGGQTVVEIPLAIGGAVAVAASDRVEPLSGGARVSLEMGAASGLRMLTLVQGQARLVRRVD